MSWGSFLGEIIERGGKEPGVPAPKPSVQKDPPSPPDAGSEWRDHNVECPRCGQRYWTHR